METEGFEKHMRTLAESELACKISRGKSLEVTEEDTFEDVLLRLTPAQREAAQAAVELYMRLQARKAKRGAVTSSNDVYELMYPVMRNLEVEECWVLCMNLAAKVIKRQRIAVGGLSAAAVDKRVIIKEALMCGSTGIILVHNHPSGKARPSRLDDEVTAELKAACEIMSIRLIDHVIISEGAHYSYQNECKL